ncbi:MAG: NAD(P)H-dependent oxidoreductase, partial [Actinomycetota bacterium]|nr:NAD(P)H-dependent oxidoreductase [Actinomycetota bacterium]
MTSTQTTEKRPHVVGVGGTLRDGSTGLRALERALAAAEEAGATTELLDLRELDLPMYEPGKPVEEFGESVEMLVQAMRGADAMLWSTAAYHGTLAGVTKNALDFAQFMARDEKPYLQDKIVGLVATAGGSMAAVNAVNAMVNVVHALRGVAAPLSVPITQSWSVFDDEGNVTDKGVAGRLESLGRLVVEMAAKLGDQETAGRIVR